MKRVAVISLGCDKNRVDTEHMLYRLEGSNYVLTQKIEEAEVIIVNTCAFIEAARAEAVDAILDAAARHPEKLVVTGCLPQKYVGDIFEELPEVDAFLGTSDYDRIAQVLDGLYESGERQNEVGAVRRMESPQKRVLTTPYHYAYLKIAEGCDNRCTYCTIPSIRGAYVSRSLESLKAEAGELAAQGVRELILVAQDTTKYGRDLYGKNSIVRLLNELSKVEGIEWLRLLYCYPEDVDEALIEELASNPKVCKYIDIPLQHCADAVLKRMGRHTGRSDVETLLAHLRRAVPEIALRSTFIVGFPGETEEQFSQLLQFLKEQRFSSAGFFPYSAEEGTPAARLNGQLEEAEKARRAEQCYALQREISLAKNRELVGKTLTVVYDGVDFERGVFFGRSQFQAPEVDGIVTLTSSRPLEVGTVYHVNITSADEYDLNGEVLHEFTE